MEDNFSYSVIITKKGQQIPVKSASGVSLSVRLPDDPVIDEVNLDITADEFADLQKLAVTNSIPADILKLKKAD
jgi:hypothetical protein